LSYLRQRLLPDGKKVADVDVAMSRALPSWDAEGRRLWLGEQLLLCFRQPAPHQTRLLDAFEEQCWISGHIDDPLPRSEVETDQGDKRGLHEPIKNLKRGWRERTIRFGGDGTGKGVGWEYEARGGPKPSRAAIARRESRSCQSAVFP